MNDYISGAEFSSRGIVAIKASVLLLLIVFCIAHNGISASESSSQNRKVIILGFDGMNPPLVRKWMKEGYLPNFSRIAAQGTFAELGTSYPCESPVAWRTFATGVNPGGHGVFDFLRKIPGTYLPTSSVVEAEKVDIVSSAKIRAAISAGVAVVLVIILSILNSIYKRVRKRINGMVGAKDNVVPSLFSGKWRGTLYIVLCVLLFAPIFIAAQKWVPKSVPFPRNITGGTPFWKYLSDAGLRTTVLRMPVEFPAREYKDTRILSGLGVPDIRGTNGRYMIYTTENVSGGNTEMGGRVVPVNFADGTTTTEITGPMDVLHDNGQRLKTELKIQRLSDGIKLEFCGTTVTLKEHKWSEWLPIYYSVSPLMKVMGQGRFYLLSDEEPFRLYLSAINFDPADLPPNVRLSSPAEFAPELRDENGFFKTLGWPTDTWALSEEHISDEVYLEDYAHTMKREKEVTLAELRQKDWDCFMAVFTPTDQIQHVFYRYLDPKHPKYRDDVSSDVKNAIRLAFMEVDEFVGQVYDEFKGDNVDFIIMSDHGFHSFRKAVNINTWLWKNGYLKLKGEVGEDGQRNLEELYTGADIFWKNVDWSSTYAYSMGLGNVYLNLEGREPEGVVRKGGMQELLLSKLKEGLLALRDPDTGEQVVRSIYFGRDLYKGEFSHLAADVVVGFNDGYRVSWQTALGGIPEKIIVDNDRKWSGDHCSVDPATNPGILLTNRKINRADVSLLDVAPTILNCLGCEKPAQYEGKSWWE